MRGLKIHTLYYLLGIAFVVLINVLFITYLQYDKALNGLQQINHSNEVLKEIYELKAALRTGKILVWNNFIIGKDSTNDFDQNEKYANRILIQLQVLVVDNKNQQARWETLRDLVSTRYKAWHELLRNMGGLDPSKFDVLRGNEVEEDIEEDTLLTQMKNEEVSLLNQRETAGVQSIKSSSLFLLITALLTAAFIGFITYLLTQMLKVTRELNIEIEHKNRELKRSNKDLEQFAYVASHDLQEPLRKIRAFGDRLKTKESEHLTEDGVRVLDKINGFAAKMQRLIDDLLEYSRITNNQLEISTVNLNQCIDDAIGSMSEQVQRYKAKITKGPLPPIRGYQTQLVRLFQNLLSNSLKYSQQNEPAVINISGTRVKGNTIIGVSEEDENRDFLKISIRDNGIGFDQQYADKIFVIFQRLHGKSEYEGTGIGLAVVKAVMANHRGYVKALGKEGEGAEFQLYFPIYQ